MTGIGKVHDDVQAHHYRNCIYGPSIKLNASKTSVRVPTLECLLYAYRTVITYSLRSTMNKGSVSSDAASYSFTFIRPGFNGKLLYASWSDIHGLVLLAFLMIIMVVIVAGAFGAQSNRGFFQRCQEARQTGG